jgi:hypothetical protein
MGVSNQLQAPTAFAPGETVKKTHWRAGKVFLLPDIMHMREQNKLFEYFRIY